ncbi:MAG: HAD family hydrolase [Candidatus Bathyarchaeota archaeon]|nr:HAD family hydrolase [Candidatus Bathyarchaeota archaeon]MDW8040686.1 HAD family hydrolase [Nitrososphaerota archaeon]
MPPKKLKLVSFDVWDTLLSITAFYRDVALELSRILETSPVMMEDKLVDGYRKVRALRRAGKFDDSKIVPAALETIAKILCASPETVAKAIHNAVENSTPTYYVMDGALETLSYVKEFGLKVAVVGNVVFWPGTHNRILLEKAGLSNFIDEQFYADEVGFSKPKSEIFTKMLSRFNVEPHEALHVGDSLFEDLAGAVLANMNAVLIDKNVNSVIRLSSWSAYIIPNIKLLEQVVRELEKH